MIEIEFVKGRENAMVKLLTKGMSIWILGQQAIIKDVRKKTSEENE